MSRLIAPDLSPDLSTLATSLVVHGARLLTDDGLVLQLQDGECLVLPSHPSVRLWEDSREALVGDRLATALAAQYTSKTRLLAGAGLPHCTEPAPLRRMYLLGNGACDNVRIQPMPAAEAALEWIRNLFLLDVEERPRLFTHFSQIGAWAALDLSYELDFPRDYTRLADVRRAILDHLFEGGASG